MMLRWVVLLLAMLAPVGAMAEAIPERRLNVARDVDFFGSDLQAIFDTDFASCQRTCLTNPVCTALTFNTRTGACFPKTGVSQEKPYAGAMSARVIVTPATTVQAANAGRADLNFLEDFMFDQAVALATDIGVRHAPGNYKVEDYTRSATQREQNGELAVAMSFIGSAIAMTDNASLWNEYARLALKQAEKDPNRGSTLRNDALSAAINGYLYTTNPGTRASALYQMAVALEGMYEGRRMIPALRLAQAAQPRDDAGALLEHAINRYGFRITDHTVESDLAEPRICAEFSEPLVDGGVDYSTFVGSATAGLAAEADGSRLCMTGVTHGASYKITLRQGLPAASGETLSRDVDLTMYVRDRSPSLAFSGRSYVLPRGAEPAIPVTTVNTKNIDLTLYHVSDRNLMPAIQERIFGRPLNGWEESRLSDGTGARIWQGTAETGMELNQNVLTRLPLKDALAGQPTGIYALQASIPGNPEAAATQWFVLSDMGLTSLSGTDGLHVFVRNLGTAAARKSVKLTLLSRSNAVLGTAVSDEKGYARFATGLLRGESGAEPALVLAEMNGDLGFLSLLDPEFDLSDRGVAGRAPSGPVDVFLATDRGAYRAGDTIHATALARDEEARVIWNLPLTAILRRPDGVEYSRTLSGVGSAGGHVFDLPISANAPRGTWQLQVFGDPDAPALSSSKLLVEDFLPERFDFALSLPNPVRSGELANLNIDALYLFGAPAGGLPVSGSLRVDAREGLESMPGYRFGRHDEPLKPVYSALPNGTVTDAEGMASIPVTIPVIPNADRPLKLTVTAQMTEGSGRPVEREITRNVTPATPLIGVKPLFDGTLGEGSEAAFDLIAVGPDGKPMDMPIEWALNRISTTYQWYQLYGDWNWEPITTRTRVASGKATLGTDPLELAQTVEWGEYELVVTRADGQGYLETSVAFDAGWYAAADAASTPDTLELSLDAEHYAPGDTAKLRIVPRYAGTALITVLAEGLIDMKAMNVKEGENTISLPVTQAWGAGAYVTASVVRPMDAAAGQMPTRSLGLTHAGVDPGSRDLDLKITVPQTARPRAPLTVDLEVLNPIETDKPIYATIAAVDVGILNLTAFKSPDPEGHYFGQRRLGVGIRDIYGRLIDSLNGATGTVRSGGDASGALSMQSPPPTEDLVTFFSGPVEFDDTGKAHVTFDIPAFDGQLRVMAIAWGDQGVGSASADVTLSDPVVVSASLPRFLAPGDTSRLLLELTHTEGASGEMALEMTSTEGVTLGAYPETVTLTQGENTSLTVPITATEAGDPAVTIALTTPDGVRLERVLRMPVRSNDPEVASTRRFDLAAGGTFTFDANVFADLQEGTGRAILSAGPLAKFDAPGLLATLDRYPYGCTEQITSAALPLLYFDQVAAALNLGQGDDLTAKVNHAITEILTRQSSNGGFGLWFADSGDFWLDAYVTDFLTRADLAGYAVPKRALRSALDNLRNQVNYATNYDEGGQDIAYALMVLARAGAANMGDLRYYADVKAGEFATPMAAAQLGAGLAAYGDQIRADRMFAQAARMIGTADTDGTMRRDYGTTLRDSAALLALATEAGSTAIDTGALTTRVALADGPRSTQESAWTLLAAHALVNDPATNALLIDDHPANGPLIQLLQDQTAKPVAIKNTGSDTQLTLTTIGVPEVPARANGYGYQITRKVYDLDGNEITTGTFASGQRYAVVLEVTPTEPLEARLMIDDPLPAGLEIDNPSLIRSGDVSSLSWIEAVDTRMTQFRSDRFLAAVDWTQTERFRLAYIVRAVTAGRYHAPAASVQDMYRPQYRAVGDTGAITVTP
ncbi:alpha-2-macroglobulin family protein [Donghicola sp. C2-DW-16]|uniref:Alpha-2-macroglobulin family protein n=2 Tax=Donghicola mangrovi TaxID=2729614 RepID=A0ABX2PEU6_9RHOB|nr:alpha-2-macroglobulin family protein [Donghicola mangrovi]